MKIKCPHCGYEWNTRSRARYLKCPSCYKSFRNPYWGSPTTTTTTTSTTSTTTTRLDQIEVEVLDYSLWEKLRSHAEEHSFPDPLGLGVEVLVLDYDVYKSIVGGRA